VKLAITKCNHWKPIYKLADLSTKGILLNMVTTCIA